jgi:hypothetical protein
MQAARGFLLIVDALGELLICQRNDCGARPDNSRKDCIHRPYSAVSL